jgi:hypothetical protein
MNYEEDLDLAIRLRRIAAEPEPAVPGSLYRFADEVAQGAAASHQGIGREAPISFTPARAAAARRPVRVLAGLAAALVLVMAVGTLLIAVNGNRGPAADSPDDWTGLEWHDITATSDGLFLRDAWQGGDYSSVNRVVEYKGMLIAIGFGSGSDLMWTSRDGRTWNHVAGAPALTALGVVNGVLVGQGTATQSTPWMSWVSNDGVNWRSAVQPFGGEDGVGGFATISTAALVLDYPNAMTAGRLVCPEVYATSDGISWVKGSLPAGFTASMGIQVSSRLGFVATEYVNGPDAPGPVVAQTYPAQGSPVPEACPAQGSSAPQGFYSWSSHDGLTWTRLDVAALGNDVAAGVYSGALGDSIPPFPPSGGFGFHTANGIAWTRDRDSVSNTGMNVSQADGRHILISAGWNVVFTVSRGDGHWRELRQGGDIGALPGGGQAFLLPDGVLYAGGGRLFYGKAVAGGEVQGSLRPAATITMAPTPTPVGATPRPAISLPPATNWTGVSGVQKVADGPAGATSITRWQGGYLALRNASMSEGTFSAWSSPDSVTWTKIPDGTFGSLPTAQAAQDGDQVVIATWGGSVAVWASSDGLHWQQSPISGPPIGGRPMAGNSWGVVALMDDPQYTIFSDLGNSVILNTGINSLHSVAVSGNRWVVVGQTDGDSPTPTGPAAWWSDDGVSWTAASVDDSPGEGLVSVLAGRNGFVAIGSATGSISGSDSFWTSLDGKTWKRGTGPWGPGATFTGDGVHIVASGIGSSGQAEFWTSLDGQNWTKLSLAGDAAILSSAARVRAYPMQDGVLFVTPDGVWYGQAVAAR